MKTSDSTAKLLEEIRKDFEGNDFDAALERAVRGLKLVPKGQARRQTFALLIGSIAKMLADSSNDLLEQGVPESVGSKNACSFCGRSAQELKILLGANGAICKNCATRAFEHFHPEGQRSRS